MMSRSDAPFHVTQMGDGAVDARWIKPCGPLRLGADDIHVWRVNVPRVARCALPSFLPLSEDERVRSESLFFATDRNRFIVAHGALRIVLSRYLHEAAADLAFVHGTHGKPALADRFAHAGIEFSLAHSVDWVVCAFVRDRSVGIDIERRRAVAEAARIATWSFSTAEQREWATADAPRCMNTFFDIWTRNEARIKGAGRGLFASLAAAGSSETTQSSLKTVDTDGFTVLPLAVAPGYRAALAFEGSASRLTLFDFDTRFLPRALSGARGHNAATGSPISRAPCGVRDVTA